ncbi:MAG: 4-hydroxy-tetrahydrodipicolinate synthase [Clostridia bacterium]|nr:4-hydroxy-tetrahydrodipicolinate synthase [Clostridia bacterium]
MEFGKYLSVIVTPFNSDNTVNYEALKKVAQNMIDGGVEGFIVAATGGESATLDLDERIELTKFMKKEFGSKAQIVVGTGNNNTAASIKTTKAIEEAGADAVLLVAPYYNKPSQEGLYQHYKAIAESTSLPVFLYNVPGRAGVKIAPSTVARLAEIPNIYGMKDASGDMDNLTTLLRTVPESFRIYTGDDNLAVPALSIGVYGLISVAAQVVPGQLAEMMDTFRAGKIKEAAEMHRNLFPVLDVLFIASNPIPTKIALNLMGYNVGGVRLPLTMPTKGQAETIAEVLFDAGLIATKEVPDNLYSK